MPTTNNPKHILKTALGAVMRQTGLVLDIDNKAPDKQFLLLKTPEATVRLELLVVEGVVATKLARSAPVDVGLPDIAAIHSMGAILQLTDGGGDIVTFDLTGATR